MDEFLLIHFLFFQQFLIDKSLIFFKLLSSHLYWFNLDNFLKKKCDLFILPDDKNKKIVLLALTTLQID